MAKYEVIYASPSLRMGLDNVIEADTYKVAGSFFEFIVNKEVVRTLKSSLVLQIKKAD